MLVPIAHVFFSGRICGYWIPNIRPSGELNKDPNMGPKVASQVVCSQEREPQEMTEMPH